MVQFMILVHDGHKEKNESTEKTCKPLNTVKKEDNSSPLPSPSSTESDDRKIKKKSSGII